ncbi:GNAT family N-acetyltransferase [Haloferax mediterranei ATCC 33500]|uniref:Acetyltransferase n=1 Tax=Haloferax mediterranei (strain ATCC 33500 / DSM 1411 / JCM 8866 / NBRC 14739 / NCIMB 2177 / R-4) TaxID=523841 RepID=I3R8T8_HALMT|nr:GNAT family N-acetyltransferase [Haloferax mediterranei]AFK20648.1 putative acetyltransferase [Haloferax mediterranei ATCC 33500]AHZ22867.1 acetyltransferase [Haloferax mediterranei ATCC 33500]EMA03032.1 putative acetyltransferase [Haloferax mediterranei ATCC 33500]MDX5987787.1 GNAT family N-acetyltransferase [Haloferax mediterranei ATCC 33500]QCQ74265.1 GNAT family N-acetyltransferase [Haloferax mediterranei ATCC 33500]
MSHDTGSETDVDIDITIRQPQAVAEMRGVWQVNSRCWVRAYEHILPEDALPNPDTPPDETELREQLDYANALNATESGRYVVAVRDSGSDNGGVVGFAATRWGDETKSFVGHDDAGLWVIYVDPSRWGDGIGSALLDAVTATIPEQYDRLVLESFAENDAGRAFYRSRGFEVVDRTETEVGDEVYPTVIMARSLTD